MYVDQPTCITAGSITTQDSFVATTQPSFLVLLRDSVLFSHSAPISNRSHRHLDGSAVTCRRSLVTSPKKEYYYVTVRRQFKFRSSHGCESQEVSERIPNLTHVFSAVDDSEEYQLNSDYLCIQLNNTLIHN